MKHKKYIGIILGILMILLLLIHHFRDARFTISQDTWSKQAATIWQQKELHETIRLDILAPWQERPDCFIQIKDRMTLSKGEPVALERQYDYRDAQREQHTRLVYDGKEQWTYLTDKNPMRQPKKLEDVFTGATLKPLLQEPIANYQVRRIVEEGHPRWELTLQKDLPLVRANILKTIGMDGMVDPRTTWMKTRIFCDMKAVPQHILMEFGQDPYTAPNFQIHWRIQPTSR